MMDFILFFMISLGGIYFLKSIFMQRYNADELLDELEPERISNYQTGDWLVEEPKLQPRSCVAVVSPNQQYIMLTTDEIIACVSADDELNSRERYEKFGY